MADSVTLRSWSRLVSCIVVDMAPFVRPGELAEEGGTKG